jgi:uncharacterized repeat protein (TIGR01451 family)
MNILNRTALKTASIFSFTLAFLLGSVLVPYFSNVSATATKQPYYKLHVRNVSQGGAFDENAKSVNLASGEIAQLRMRVGNVDEGNDISSLRFKAFFTDQVNPTEFHADIKADELDWVGGKVDVDVPDNTYLEYVPGSTVLDKDDRPEFFTRTFIEDINGTSPLAFNDGMDVTNVPAHDHQWLWVYFKVKAVTKKPVVINPRLDLIKHIANTTDGEDFDDQKTETTAGPGDTVAFRVIVKNGIEESTLHNVVVSDQKPQGNKTPQVLIATATSDEDTNNKLVTVNITNTQEINLISGSVVLKDLFGKKIKTLSAAEVSQLFGKGLALDDIQGTFEFARVIEYKAKVSQVKDIPPTQPIEQLPDTGPSAGAILLLGAIPAGVVLRKIGLKI